MHIRYSALDAACSFDVHQKLCDLPNLVFGKDEDLADLAQQQVRLMSGPREIACGVIVGQDERFQGGNHKFVLCDNHVFVLFFFPAHCSSILCAT
jgi:hypothetical protein